MRYVKNKPSINQLHRTFSVLDLFVNKSLCPWIYRELLVVWFWRWLIDLFGKLCLWLLSSELDLMLCARKYHLIAIIDFEIDSHTETNLCIWDKVISYTASTWTCFHYSPRIFMLQIAGGGHLLVLSPSASSKNQNLNPAVVITESLFLWISW